MGSFDLSFYERDVLLLYYIRNISTSSFQVKN